VSYPKSDKTLLQQIVDTAKQKYGGNLDMAIRTDEVREPIYFCLIPFLPLVCCAGPEVRPFASVFPPVPCIGGHIRPARATLRFETGNPAGDPPALGSVRQPARHQ